MDVNQQYISPYKIRKKFDITSNTLKTWGESAKIRFIRIRGGKGKRLYNVEDVEKIMGVPKEESNTDTIHKQTICYARVSSDHQKEDLNRQIELLHKTYPTAFIISDVGSGLNFKRKGFQTLLDRVYSGLVKTIIVTYKDRLCRFGFELFEWILKKTNTELLVLNPSSIDQDNGTGTSELAEDLLSITNFFVARNNGIRSAKFRKLRKEEKLKNQEEIQEKSKETEESSEGED